MKVYVLRHGEAEERTTSWAVRDDERPLTRAGIKKFKRSLSGLRAMGLEFHRVLSSPLTRARQTAEIFCAGLNPQGGLEFTSHLSPSGDPRKLIAHLRKYQAKQENVIVVGHEPYLSQLIGKLIWGNENGRVKLKKGGICCLKTGHLKYGPCATLNWLLTPRQLLLIGGER